MLVVVPAAVLLARAEVFAPALSVDAVGVSELHAAARTVAARATAATKREP